MPKQPLSDDERQDFIDKLPDDQVNAEAEETFNDAIERASQPVQSAQEKQEPSDGYRDKQTHSDNTEDTSG
jgi:hypothetical protein